MPTLTSVLFACPLDSLPSQGLDKLTSLELLDLTNTYLTWIPAEIEALDINRAVFPSSCESDDIMIDLDVEYFLEPKPLVAICRFLQPSTTSTSSPPPPSLTPTHSEILSTCQVGSDKLDTLPLELRERLEGEKRKCSSCGRIYYGKPRGTAKTVHRVCGKLVWVGTTYCYMDCDKVCAAYFSVWYRCGRLLARRA